jgi:hypothetical protein
VRLERHHERQPGPGQLAAEPVLVAAGGVRGHRPEREPRGHRPEREPRGLSPDRQIRADRQPGPAPGSPFPYGKCRAGVQGTACTG